MPLCSQLANGFSKDRGVKRVLGMGRGIVHGQALLENDLATRIAVEFLVGQQIESVQFFVTKIRHAFVFIDRQRVRRETKDRMGI